MAPPTPARGDQAGSAGKEAGGVGGDGSPPGRAPWSAPARCTPARCTPAGCTPASLGRGGPRGGALGEGGTSTTHGLRANDDNIQLTMQ